MWQLEIQILKHLLLSYGYHVQWMFLQTLHLFFYVKSLNQRYALIQSHHSWFSLI